MARTDRLAGPLDATISNILEVVPDVIVTLRADGRIAFASERVRETLGFDPAELEGQPIEALVPQRFHARHREHVNAYFRDPRPRSMGAKLDLWALRKDGKEVPVEISLNAVSDESGVLAIAAIRDVTERKQIELELRRANDLLWRSNQDLENVAGALAQDLAAPLRAIGSHASALRNDPATLPVSSREALDRIVSATARIHQMIQGLLTYSKLQSSALDAVSIPATDALREAVANLEEPLRDAGAKLRFVDLPRVKADRQQLVTVFQNLLGNSLKFRRVDQPPTIDIAATTAGAEIVISVRDDGVGFAPERAKDLFQLFRRLHPEHEFPGTGVGLALCAGIIHRHGGKIWADSSPAGGATFSFTLPGGE